MKQEQPRLLGGIVDRIAVIHAQIQELKEEADGLRQVLIEADQAFVIGQYHQASIAFVPGKLSTDWQSIARRFSPSRQLIAAHSKRGEDYYRLCISDISAN
jgi:hypothetical protein